MKKSIMITTLCMTSFILCSLLFSGQFTAKSRLLSKITDITQRECSASSRKPNTDDTLSSQENLNLKSPKNIVLEKVFLEKINRSRRYPGTVNACNESRLAFRVGGPLIKVNIQPGDMVKKGDILMQIDPQDFKDQIQVLNARIKGARSQLETAKLDFNRIQKLVGQNVAPQADFDHARNLRSAAESAVEQLRAELAIARHKLSYTFLAAPYNGMITFQNIENYEMVAPGQVVVGLHDISQLEIRINVPENEIANHPLKAGSPATARFPAVGDQPFRAVLKEWNTSADRSSSTYAITFIMPHPEHVQILPGMTAEIQWTEEQSSAPAVTIPAGALVTNTSRQAFVWIFNRKTSTASRQPVTPGPLCKGSRLIIEKGLSPGDEIVTQGVDFIVENMPLTPVIKNKTKEKKQP